MIASFQHEVNDCVTHICASGAGAGRGYRGWQLGRKQGSNSILTVDHEVGVASHVLSSCRLLQPLGLCVCRSKKCPSSLHYLHSIKHTPPLPASLPSHLRQLPAVALADVETERQCPCRWSLLPLSLKMFMR